MLKKTKSKSYHVMLIFKYKLAKLLNTIYNKSMLKHFVGFVRFCQVISFIISHFFKFFEKHFN